MATLLLAAAGTGIGSAIGGTALGVSVAGIGQAVGAVSGGVLDQRILGNGSKVVEQGRAKALQIQSSTEGQAIPVVFGTLRVAGTLIWSTRFKENISTSREGGKGAPSVTIEQYSYTISCAFGICTGEIQNVGRIWADGKLVEPDGLNYRIYRGSLSQLPDEKISSIEGIENTPSFRGTAYIVFDDLPIGKFGNRIPQFNFEVFRPVNNRATGPEAGRPLADLITAVALSPGTGEFALDPEPARLLLADGSVQSANINNLCRKPDILVSFDQLEQDLPLCRSISLVISWFGNDLRCGHCQVEPRAEASNRNFSPEPWEVAGLDTTNANLVGTDTNGRPIFGGTPSDGSVIRAIKMMHARSHSVMLYPFLLMDIPPGNSLENPYTGTIPQPPYPWRGRITLNRAPGQDGSVDKTEDARAQVDNFFGTVRADDFIISNQNIQYNGPNEWSWSRFVLHTAALGAAAGGVDSMVVGSELPGLTTIRSGPSSYPSIEHLIRIVGEVKKLLPMAKLSYAADWSEYFGHQPNDNSGDRIFHLDEFWSNELVDFVGIDDYLPISDWRYHTTNSNFFDGAISQYSLDYLKANIEGGEYFDFFYKNDDDRFLGNRTPIQSQMVDQIDETWVFRPKDIRGWWGNFHHNRVLGERQENPTNWVPKSKPIWLTEMGCPAVDLGANMPNLFFDPKSSESAVPPGSSGARDDEIQRRYLQAKLDWYREETVNPRSDIYDGVMVPIDRIFVWTWDARPFPDFPARIDVWSDGPSYSIGHWINGRTKSTSLADIIHEVASSDFLFEVNVNHVFGTVSGFLIDQNFSAREAIQPLITFYGVDMYESGNEIIFKSRANRLTPRTITDDLIFSENGNDHITFTFDHSQSNPSFVKLSFFDHGENFNLSTASSSRSENGARYISAHSFPIATVPENAKLVAERWLSESWAGRERLMARLPFNLISIEPTDIISLDSNGQKLFRVESVDISDFLNISCVRVTDSLYLSQSVPTTQPKLGKVIDYGIFSIQLLELPIYFQNSTSSSPFIAATANPWQGRLQVYWKFSEEDYSALISIGSPATSGTISSQVATSEVSRWNNGSFLLHLENGSLQSRSRIDVLNGFNAIAVEVTSGEWEIIQFQSADLIATSTYRISKFIRGQRGTEFLSNQEIQVGSRFFFVDQALVEIPDKAFTVGRQETFRIGPAQRPPTDNSYVEKSISVRGVWYRPFAPAQLRCIRVGENDYKVSWLYRSRLDDYDFWSDLEVARDPEFLSFRLTISFEDDVLLEADVLEEIYYFNPRGLFGRSLGGIVTISVSEVSRKWGQGPESRIDKYV